MTSNTPGDSRIPRTHISFGGMKPLIMNIKLVEAIQYKIGASLKQAKVLDAVLQQLAIFSEVMKAKKVTLFVIDEEL
jgi:hypothetical protein